MPAGWRPALPARKRFRPGFSPSVLFPQSSVLHNLCRFFREADRVYAAAYRHGYRPLRHSAGDFGESYRPVIPRAINQSLTSLCRLCCNVFREYSCCKKPATHAADATDEQNGGNNWHNPSRSIMRRHPGLLYVLSALFGPPCVKFDDATCHHAVSQNISK